jgi:flavin-dependent dehydrogenase
MPDRRLFDVLVLGGGPAGATAAALLAAWGRSVVVVHRESMPARLAESLPPSIRKLLQFLGQLRAVEAARFHSNHGNRSHWAGSAALATSADSGYHVLRRDFDRVLLEHARSCGALIVDGQIRAVDLRREPEAQVLAENGSLRRYAASFVLDCSGRAGIIARKGLRRLDAGYRTLAIAAEWTCENWPRDESTHTLIDSYEDGWAWSVPLSSQRRQCTVMIDRDRTAISRSKLAATYRAELEKAQSIAERLRGASQVGAPWACDATVYRAVRAAEGRALLVGDAASFIEPLSSAGVKKALTSAWRAAVVVNTCLERPGMQGAAFDLFDRREQVVHRECRQRSAAFFKEAADFHHDEFWTRRAGSARGAVDDSTAEGTEQELESDSSTRRAFERLRDTPDLRLRPIPELRFEKAADIEGREVVLRDAIRVPGIGVPLRFAAGINLPELVRASGDCQNVPATIERYQRRVGAIDPQAVLTGLSILVAKGILRIRESGNRVIG